MADVTSTFAAKDVGFTSTVNRMQRSLAGFQSGIAGFAAKAAGLVTAFVGIQQSVAAFNKALSMGGRLDDLSKTTGATAGELLLLEKAFELAGSSADAVGPAIARLNRFMVEASNGGAAQVETMNKLGLSYDQLKGRTPTEQMQLLAKSIMALPTPAQRTAAAMDIFGRSGSTLIPLFANFSGELDKAQGYLGSLPGLMDQSAGAMADMEDDIGALGDKFNQFVAGLVAGAAGAENLASALAKIDTAGIGANLGESLRVAFDAPHETAKAIGYTLLTGAKQAGNNLINAFSAAIEFFQKVYGDPEYWSGVGQRIKSVFMEAVNAFNKLLLTGIEQGLLKPLSNLPGIIGDPFREALKSVQSIRTGLEATSQKNYDDWTQGGEKIKSAIARAAETTEVIEKDWLGVEQSAADAARHFQDAQDKSAAIRDNSAETAKNFGEGSAAIRSALEDIRGFDLKGEMGPDARPDWTKSTKPPPENSSQRIANEEANARALYGPRGGGTTAPPTEGMRAAMLRGESRGNRARQRGNKLAEAGMYLSAVRAFDQADRLAGLAAENQRVRDFYGSEFGAGNAGEAFGEFRDMFGGLNSKSLIEKGLEDAGLKYDPTRDEQANFDRLAREQSKTPEERKAEEQAMRDKHAPSGGKSDLEKVVGDVLSLLKQHMPSIDEKLPQHALVPG
jgi:hypothetical protein